MARYKKCLVNYGDTIQAIAQRETHDVTRWQEIVKYNGLQYPYIVDTILEKLENPDHLVTHGDILIIPVETSLMDQDPNKLDKQDMEMVYNLVLGSDLGTVWTEDEERHGTSDEIFSLSADTRGDILTVAGLDNLKQALNARLLTPKGALLLHPNYGSNLHKLFNRATRNQIRLIENEIMRTLKTDARVQDVQVISSVVDGDTYSGSFTVYLQSFKEYFDLLVSMDTTGNLILS